MIVVEEAGLRTTVQDLGRPGLGHLGVPTSGAADRFSLRLANLLVGNADGAAALETTLVGPSLRFETAAVVAVTGAPVPITLDGADVPAGVSFLARRGQLLRVGRAGEGVRSYLAVAGGIDAKIVLGSRSTDTLSGLGPAVLRAGDVLRLESVPADAGFAQARPPYPAVVGRRVPASVLAGVLPTGLRAVRVVPNPARDWFSRDATALLYRGEFTVSPASDRVGVRLSGPRLERTRAGEAATEGVVTGSIQVPPDGLPIVLLADHAVTGGYPVIAVVACVDVSLIAQARPGTTLRFAEVSVAAARRAYATTDGLLGPLRDRSGRDE
jgi:biotin-dependent carboxylase-like uncharacterized protein